MAEPALAVDRLWCELWARPWRVAHPSWRLTQLLPRNDDAHSQAWLDTHFACGQQCLAGVVALRPLQRPDAMTQALLRWAQQGDAGLVQANQLLLEVMRKGRSQHLDAASRRWCRRLALALKPAQWQSRAMAKLPDEALALYLLYLWLPATIWQGLRLLLPRAQVHWLETYPPSDTLPAKKNNPVALLWQAVLWRLLHNVDQLDTAPEDLDAQDSLAAAEALLAVSGSI